MQSEEISLLAEALAKAQGTIKNPIKNKTVSVTTKSGHKYEFQYADLTAIMDAAKRPLADNGLSYVQLLQQSEDAKYKLHTMLLHASGQWIESVTPLLVQEQGSQAFGSALTFMKRYALSAMLGIAADSDDDANVADGNAAKVAERKPTLPTPAAVAAKAEITVDGGEPREIVLGDNPDWIWFGQTMIALAGGPQWPDWDEANRNNFARMEKEAPKVYTRMTAAFKKVQKPVSKKQKAQPELKDDPEAYLKWLEGRCKEQRENDSEDYWEFAKSQGEIIRSGFPPDQMAANDIIQKHAPQ
jgi:hypothetical protein